MMLLTAENRKALPALYANENVANPKAVVKFFTPDANATWYASEFDGEDTFFGLADLGFGFPELGNFSLSELKALRGSLGLPVERDRHFTPKPLAELVALRQERLPDPVFEDRAKESMDDFNYKGHRSHY